MNAPAIKVKLIHEVCLKVLDMFYMKRKQVLVKLCRLACVEVTNKDISMLGADYLLLATAVIAAASHILDEKVSKTVNYYSDCIKQHLQVFSSYTSVTKISHEVQQGQIL